MIGLLLVLAATFFTETQDTIGKRTIQQGRQSIYTMGFLSLVWSFLFFLVILVFIKKEFIFSRASLPTFLARAALEVVLAHISLLALTKADRSTFSLVRVGTIPLLLAVDIFLGYSISPYALAGIGVIILTLLFSLWNHNIRKEGISLVIATAIIATATLSLFKYNITHFNSLEAEQAGIIFLLLIYLFIMARFVAKENPFLFLKQPIFLVQSLSTGLGGVLVSFAYLFGAASVITAATRALSVLWAITSGNLYFKEKHTAVKLILFSFLAIGLVLISR